MTGPSGVHSLGKGFARLQFAVVLIAGLLLNCSVRAADGTFEAWLAALWPEAKSLGVLHETFIAATRNLEPDLSLPDLVIPGRPERPPPGQPEFVQTPADYLKEATIANLAARGQALAQTHRTTLTKIEHRFGVPANIILAIWGRESDYGRYQLPHNAIRALATQAYLGKRKEQFRGEFLHALKILQDGEVRLADMRSSWAGAMGQTQLLPSDFYRYAVDFDGDGHRNIWTSVPDALASAARQLVAKGWQSGSHWAYEVRAPDGFDCTAAQPEVTMPIGAWLDRGFKPAYGRMLSKSERALAASLLMPEGIYGPGFLTPKNYFVIKDYNFSDLYVLFVGHLADRIGGGPKFETPWSKDSQLKTAQVETMQRRLAELGLYRDKVDGKAGMLTRAALGAYQKANGLKLDCWPTRAVLRHMQGTRVER